MMNKVVLLDRDGVINQDSAHYIKSVDEFVPVPGSMEAIARLTQAGFLVGIATNQSGLSRGLYTEAGLAAIHARMNALVARAGGEIHAIEYCPHLPETGCPCRKPAAGMLLSLAKRLGCSELTGIPFVGDKLTDVQAALCAGAEPYVVLSPMTDKAGLLAYPSVPVFASLSRWVDAWLATWLDQGPA